MDCDRIIKNGYGRLAELLPAADKGFLEGYNQAFEDVQNFYFDEACYDEVKMIRKLKMKIAEHVIRQLSVSLSCNYQEYLISFVDNNHYSIDEDGNIIDDDEEGGDESGV